MGWTKPYSTLGNCSCSKLVTRWTPLLLLNYTQSHMVDAKTVYGLLILCHTIAIPEQEEITSKLSS